MPSEISSDGVRTREFKDRAITPFFLRNAFEVTAAFIQLDFANMRQHGKTEKATSIIGSGCASKLNPVGARV